MAKTKADKKELLKSYNEKIKSSKALVVLKPSKITPNESNEFRKEIFDSGASLNIVKNSIFKIALKENNLPEMKDLEFGEHAVLFLVDDIVSPSKALKKFIEATRPKNQDSRIQIIGGIMDGAELSKEQVTELAEMPSFEGSIALILGVLDMAMSGVANVLEDSMRGTVSVLDQAFKE